MKQSVVGLTIAMGFLAMFLMACEFERNTQPTSVTYSLDDSCTRIKSIISDSDPSNPDVVTYVSDEELQEMQNELNQPSSYNLDILNGQDRFFIDITINVGDGNRIYLVQHEEDFINNSSINVESVELEWIDGSRNSEGTVRLIGQRVGEGLMELTFTLRDPLSDCVDILEIIKS